MGEFMPQSSAVYFMSSIFCMSPENPTTIIAEFKTSKSMEERIRYYAQKRKERKECHVHLGCVDIVGKQEPSHNMKSLVENPSA